MVPLVRREAHLFAAFSVSYPGAIRCHSACFCYTYFVPMRIAVSSGSSDSFPYAYRHSTGKMQGKVSTLAMRTSSCLCRMNIKCTVTFLDVQPASGHEAWCDGSFHERHHMRLLRCGAILVALAHAAPRLATLMWEYHTWGALALDASA